MTEMISMAVLLHLLAIFMMLAVIVWILVVLSSNKEFKALSVKYEAVSLYYRALLGVLFFTGLVVMAVSKFDVIWMVYVMVLVALVMIGTTIKESIVYKLSHIKDAVSQETFKAYAKKKYISDIVLIVLTALVSYAVSL